MTCWQIVGALLVVEFYCFARPRWIVYNRSLERVEKTLGREMTQAERRELFRTVLRECRGKRFDA